MTAGEGTRGFKNRNKPELWKDTVRFPGFQVSSFGRVRSLKRGSPHLCRQQRDADGYHYVAVNDYGKHRKLRVGAEVATAFIGPRPKGLVCAHKDGDLENDRMSNLKWCTQQENIDDKVVHGTMAKGERIWCSKLTKEFVIWLRCQPKRRGLFLTWANKLGISREALANAYYGRTWRHVPG